MGGQSKQHWTTMSIQIIFLSCSTIFSLLASLRPQMCRTHWMHCKLACQSIVLNRDVNSGSRTKAYYKMVGETCQLFQTPRPFLLTSIAGYSDQAHFAET